VMENLGVYRARFGDGNTVALDAKPQRGTVIEGRAQ
jgi:hypothetical protein